MPGCKRKTKGAVGKGKPKRGTRQAEGRNVNAENDRHHVELAEENQPNASNIESNEERQVHNGRTTVQFVEDNGGETQMEVSNAIQLRAPSSELAEFPGPRDTEEEGDVGELSQPEDGGDEEGELTEEGDATVPAQNSPSSSSGESSETDSDAELFEEFKHYMAKKRKSKAKKARNAKKARKERKAKRSQAAEEATDSTQGTKANFNTNANVNLAVGVASSSDTTIYRSAVKRGSMSQGEQMEFFF